MIRRINPFILLGVLASVLVFMFIGVQKKEKSIQERNINLANYEARAKMLQELKRGWEQKNIATKLSSLVSTSKLKANSSSKQTNDRIIMTFLNVDKSEADKLIKDFLNEQFDVKKLSIKRLSEDNLEIMFEVSL